MHLGGVRGVSYYGVRGKETRRSLESMGGDAVRIGLQWSWTMTQAGRVLVIGNRRNAEYKSDVKKKKRGSSVYR